MLIMKLIEAVVYGQPDFPLKDITEEGAWVIRGILRDPTALKTFHTAAEEVHSHYGDTHAMVTAAVAAEYDKPEARAASIGATAYEATSCLVQLTTPAIGSGTFERIYDPVNDTQLVINSFQEYLDELVAQMPNMVTVVRNIASQYIDGDSKHALLGAATSRALDLQLHSGLH